MTEPGNHALILQKLDQQSERLSSIENAVSKIAVQEEKIEAIREQVTGLWRKYDYAFGPDGIISRIKNHQAACPRDEVKSALARQWAAIGIIATIMTGVFFKAIGLI